MRVRSLFAFSLLMLILTACSSTRIKSDYDVEMDFKSYKTYEWVDTELPGDELAKTPFLYKRIKVAIDETLQNKGYTLATEGDADFAVVAHGGVQEKTQVTTWSTGYWYNPWWGSYGGNYVEVNQYDEGTLVIDIVDMAKKELAWRGLASGIVKEYSSPTQIQKRVDDTVKQILSQFPPK